MTVKKVYSRSKNGKGRPGWKYDARAKKHYSYAFQMRLADGTRKQVSGFPTEKAAEQAAANIRLGEMAGQYGIAGPVSFTPTLAELVKLHLARSVGAKETMRATRVLTNWLELLPAGLRVQQVISDHIRLYVEFRTPDLKPSSINRELNIIVACLNAAPSLYPALAQWRSPKTPRPRVSKRRRERVISADEVVAVLSYLLRPREPKEYDRQVDARRRVGLVFKFALLTGARHGEIDSIRWEQVDWAAKIIQIIGTKNEFKVVGSIRYLEITDAMMDILLERRRVSTSEFVFHDKVIGAYYRTLKNACEAVGVLYGKNVPGALITHDSRHTAITRMLQAGIDLSTIGSISGHTDKTLILNYGHASARSKKEAAEVLEDFVTGTDGKSRANLRLVTDKGNVTE